MSVTFLKSENHCLVNKQVLMDVEDGIMINKLKSFKENSLEFDQESNQWIYKKYKSNVPLIELLYPDTRVKALDFKNNNVNDYRRDNLSITVDERFNSTAKPPQGYTVLKEGEPYKVTEGKFAGQYRNMYWKVSDSNNETYYCIHIKDDIYTKVSKRDIDKVLSYEDSRPSWYIGANGYVASTIRSNGNTKYIYLHQLIMDVHNDDLTSLERTVDHINQDKLDNRRTNLRLVDMSVQNSNRGKAERRSDACDLPDNITQKDLPKHVVYRKEYMDKEKTKYREFFYICNHPKLDKTWETSKSSNVTIQDKLKQAKLKLQLLDNQITEKEYNTQMGLDQKLDMPKYISFDIENKRFNLDMRKDGERRSLRYTMQSNNIQDELTKCINDINKKYPGLNFENYTIKNTRYLEKLNGELAGDNVNSNTSPGSSSGATSSPETQATEIQVAKSNTSLTLPPNFSYFIERDGQPYFCFNKVINKERHNTKYKLRSNDIQKEFNDFISIVNSRFPHLKVDPYTIPNLPVNTIKLETSIIKPEANTIKPIMPNNFSITKVNGIDYIQFCKKINDKKAQYKTKINSHDIKAELLRFINELNEKYQLGLNPSDYLIVNTNGWITTNDIIVHEDTPEKQSQRDKTNKYLEKKKQEIGEDKFKQQKAEYARKYRSSNKDIDL